MNRLIVLITAAAFACSAPAAERLKIGFLSTLSGPAAGLGYRRRKSFGMPPSPHPPITPDSPPT
jgi:hypothetical protein